MKQRMAALKAAPGAQFAAPISATTYNVIVLRIDFSDQVMIQTQAQADAVMTNIKNFYLENSYGFLTMNATTTGSGTGGNGAFRMPQPLSYYANGSNSKYTELAQDAVNAANAFVNFSLYDHIMIYHAGNGAESGSGSQITSNIWSVYAPSSFLAGDGKIFPGVTFVPESEFQSIDPLGVICHEYGHQLGLPDLYNGENGASKVGVWSLMDAGAYLPNPAGGGFARGENPAHLDAWSKLFLGFSSPETISLDLTGSIKVLTQAETSRSSFIRLPIGVSSVAGGGNNEYFLLEYRRSGILNGAAYDKFLPGVGGLLIWHVDDSINLNLIRQAANNVNNGVPHLGVDLIEAGTTDSSSGGSSADPWPGSASAFQTPKSKAFNGEESGIVVSNISGAGQSSISLKVTSLIQKVPTSVGSVGVGGGIEGYTNPNKFELVRITLRPTSSGEVSLKIYSSNGDLVHERSVPVTAGGEPTFTWDSKNNDKEVLPSGIYVLHTEGGGIDSKNKIAIIK